MAQTPNPHRKLRFSMAPLPNNPAQFYTPRPERRSVDLRWTDSTPSRYRNEKEQEVPVQVVLRCRPLNDEEQRMNVQNVISCNEQKREVSVPLNILTKQSDKIFTFDKVFGPKAQQKSVYDQAISPIVNEVIEGYNCTVFAFGQTGTGKTYTMQGDMKSKVEDLSANAGVIPRAVKHIFDILEERKTDYSMKVTFLELYNEEITDLLSIEEQNKSNYEEKQRKPICLLEDGKGGEVIRGLEEITVYNANEIYNLLETGSSRRRSVDTSINKQSSRSHVVFSINIHMKEEKWGDEELLKFGRLNLVDLAGSENIARSGAKDGKAREAGEINKSLLTLGRVITALSEHNSHIPYRNSKLTRLLRESLGGKAKTCIIATISPSINCLEETLVTLDYASKAKNIKNKPEANQRVSKAMLLKDLQVEIAKMKQDVKAAREKNGIYIPQERFTQEEAEKKAMMEKIESLEVLVNKTRKECENLKYKYFVERDKNSDKDDEIKEYKINLENTQRDLHEVQKINSKINTELKEKDFIISSLLSRENEIVDYAKNLHNTIENTSHDISNLSSKIERQSNKEGKNKELMQNLNSQLENGFKALQNTINQSVTKQKNLLQSTEENISSYFVNKSTEIEGLKDRIKRSKYAYLAGAKHMKEIINAFKNMYNMHWENTDSALARQINAIDLFMTNAVSESGHILNDIFVSLIEHNDFLDSSFKLHEEALTKNLSMTMGISQSTINFFYEMKNRISLISANAEEIKTKAVNGLERFQRAFMEVSADQERYVFHQIAEVLANMSAHKNQMLSRAVHRINEEMQRDNEDLMSVIYRMHHDTNTKEDEWLRLTEYFQEKFDNDRAENDNSRALSVRKIQHCLDRVDDSLYHWMQTQNSLGELNKEYYNELDIYSQLRKRENESYLKEILNVSTGNDSKFQDVTTDILISSQKWLDMDLVTKEKLEKNTSASKDYLESLVGNYAENESFIRNIKNKCLNEDYLVASPMINIKKAPIQIPNLESMEDLRVDLNNIITEFREKNKVTNREEGKKVMMIDGEKRGARSPLAALNQNDD
ncbi:hypothetical protein LUZ60_012985 [Juncus effusus]|nr:hypothetical protein LUZ60_012985 [Juncus effusus]